MEERQPSGGGKASGNGANMMRRESVASMKHQWAHPEGANEASARQRRHQRGADRRSVEASSQGKGTKS